MQLGLPVFILFSIYGIVNTYLPVVLRLQGFSASNIGLLLALFEISGIIFPLLVSPVIERKKLYGWFLLAAGVVMVLLPIPLLYSSGFWASALFLSIFAVGFKGAVPVSDTMINNALGTNRARYGQIRVMGSIGFVIMTLIMQFFLHIETAGKRELVLWFIIPAVLFCISLLITPSFFTVPHRSNTEADAKTTAKKRTLKDMMHSLSQFPPIYWAGICMVFFCFFALTPASKFFSLYVQEYLHLPAAAALWALSATAEIPFMFFSNRFLRRYGSFKLIVFCTFVAGIRILLYILIPNIYGAVLGQLLNSVTYGLLHPAAVLFATEYAPENSKMLSMGFYSLAAVGLASIIGNAAGGMIIDHAGYPALFYSFGSIPFIVLIVWFFVKKHVISGKNQLM